MVRTKNETLMIFVLLAVLSLTGCMSGPQVRSEIVTEYTVTEDSKGKARKTIDNVTVEDLGEAGQVVSPLRVQACQGGNLLYKDDIKCNALGQCWEVQKPVFVNYTPLDTAHVRKIKIQNNTDHVLSLQKADIVLIDPAGGEHTFADKDELAEDIMNNRPCSSSKKIVDAVSKVTLFGDTMKIRPGRNKMMYVAFPTLDIDMPGDWLLEMHNMPVGTDAAGNISKAVSFDFPFEIEEVKTKIDYKKDGTFKPWVEVSRNIIQ